MSRLLEHVEESIRVRKLFQRRESILVAVSGGLDSTVLLRVLSDLATRHSWRLTVAHLNHQLRGRSSDADERLVLRAGRELGLKVVTARADVKGIVAAQKLSIEMAARKARHEFLARTAERLKICAIALAHHADDRIELFFLRLLRGAGTEGLAAMKWKSPSPFNAKIQLVRPLFDLPKVALAEFARAEKIPFREDATNASLDFQRNRIRHELLPLLRERYQPALNQTIQRVIEIAGAESEFVRQFAAEWLETDGRRQKAECRGQGTEFCSLPIAVQRRAIQIQLQRQRIAPEFELIERVRICPEFEVSVGPDLWVSRDVFGMLRVRHGEVHTHGSERAEFQLAGEAGEFSFGNVTFRWRVERHRPSAAIKPFAGIEFFDAERVGPRIVLRHWRPGDRFEPIGLRAAAKLQDLFTNRKIPRGERHKLVVAASEAGELFWVERLRISERFKLTTATTRRLRWQWQRS